MAEPSSTITAFRGFVMLLCVALVLLAAVCGTSFPDVVKAIQNGRWPTVADFRGTSASPRARASEAPRFAPQPAVATTATNGTPAGLAQTTQQAAPLVQPFVPTPPANFATPAVVPVSYDAPMAGSTPSPGQSTSFSQSGERQNRSIGGATSRGLSTLPQGSENLVPLQRGAAANPPELGASLQPACNSPGGGNGAANPDAQFQHIHVRLKQLGATYYLLEAWGDRHEAFRFYCQMAIGGNPHVTRPFYCVDSDPVKAMTNVLQQVEEWQSGGATPSAGQRAAPPQSTP